MQTEVDTDVSLLKEVVPKGCQRAFSFLVSHVLVPFASIFNQAELIKLEIVLHLIKGDWYIRIKSLP